MTAAVALSVWFVVAVALVVGNHRWRQAQRATLRREAAEAAEVRRWLAERRVTQDEVDAVRALLTGEQQHYDRAFADILTAEGLDR